MDWIGKLFLLMEGEEVTFDDEDPDNKKKLSEEEQKMLKNTFHRRWCKIVKEAKNYNVQN